MMKTVMPGLAAIVLFTTALEAQTLRLSSFEPPTAYITSQVITPWAEDVTAAADGEFKIQVFAGGTLGRSPAQQLKLVEDGVADIAWVIPGYTPGRFDEGTVAELPFLVRDSVSGSAALWSMYEQGLLGPDYDKFKLLCVCVSAPTFIGATREVRVPADVKGMKMRAPGPTQLAAINALGAVPVGGITGPTVAESISRGLIGGSLLEWSASETFSIDEVVTHYNTVTLGATPMLILMNKARYEGLSEAARAAIDKYAGASFSKRFGKAFDVYNAAARKRIVAEFSPAIIDPDEDLSKQWKDVVAPATDTWIASRKNGQNLFDAFVRALEANAKSN